MINITLGQMTLIFLTLFIFLIFFITIETLMIITITRLLSNQSMSIFTQHDFVEKEKKINDKPHEEIIDEASSIFTKQKTIKTEGLDVDALG